MKSHLMDERLLARLGALGLALAVAAPLVYVSMWSGFAELSSFDDPCVLWGHKSGALFPSESCPSISATSETKLGVVRRLLLVQGMAITASCLGLVGAYRSIPGVTLVGAVILFLLSIPLMVSYGFLVFGLAATLLASSILSRHASSAGKAGYHLHLYRAIGSDAVVVLVLAAPRRVQSSVHAPVHERVFFGLRSG